MAAYAALVSLVNTVEPIQKHPRLSFSFDKKQIKSLLEIVDFLLDFIEGFSHGGCKEAEILESQIASAAHKAEDVIETHVVNQIRAESIIPHWSFLAELQKAIEEMDSVKKMAMKVKEEKGFKEEQHTYSNPVATSSRPLTTGKSSMVGFDDELLKLMDLLTAGKPDRQIIPIVGMGGIGKTALARNVYEHSLIVQYFHVRTWVTVSQKYNVSDILFELLSVIKNQDTSENLIATANKQYQDFEDKLGEQLYKILCGKRYLIIVDDIWSIEAWNEIESFFPKFSSGSRIVVTTRLSKVATYFGSLWHEKKFLDKDQSWRLFCVKAFAGESFPPELMNVGKKIVEKCKGLPLSIVVMGGLLQKSPRSVEYWESVAEDVNSILNSSADDYCSSKLSLSYNHLPPHLKPCFLYMGVFREDREIRVSRLLKLWVAEGFLKQDETRSLERIAESYLSDLIERNLVLVRRWGSNGGIRTCYVHDLLRDLCIRVSEREKFLCVMRVPDIPQGIDRERRIVFHENIVYSHNPLSPQNIIINGKIVFPDETHKRYLGRVVRALKSARMVRSVICEDGGLFEFRLLRVFSITSGDSLNGIFDKVNLKYLACDISPARFDIPSSISYLWNVQTVILRGGVQRIFAPYKIWDLRQLRHLEFDEIDLPDPHPSYQRDDIVLGNLQTLLKVVNFKWNERACKSIPNVTKLHVNYDDFSASSSEYCLYNIGTLQKLESLNCLFGKLPDRDDLLQNLKFPSSLKKLCLTKCQLHWEDLTMIGSLPYLEVLKLGLGSVVGAEWNPVEGQFLRLKYLKIHYSNLTYWNVESSHFPALESLVLNQFFDLDEIPSSIGDIHSLKVIHLDYCKVSAVISAMNILEEQESLGNESLQVRVLFCRLREIQSIRKIMEQQSFRSNNFFVSC